MGSVREGSVRKDSVRKVSVRKESVRKVVKLQLLHIRKSFTWLKAVSRSSKDFLLAEKPASVALVV